MFEDRVAGKSQKYLASQTFTAGYPALDRKNRMGSIRLWLLVFICKFTESYFYLTLSFSDSMWVIVGMKIQGCEGQVLRECPLHGPDCNHADDHVYYGSGAVLFWTPFFGILFGTQFLVLRGHLRWGYRSGLRSSWREIYTQLPKRIYAKILATGDMEAKYKPKVCSIYVYTCVIFRCLYTNYRF